MSNVQFGTVVGVRKFRGLYTGSDTMYQGMVLCYDSDTTTNYLGLNKADDSRGTTTVDGYQNEGKFMRLEKAKAGNIKMVAGIVSQLAVRGAGPYHLDMHGLDNGGVVAVRSASSVTHGDALYASIGSYTVDTAGDVFVGYAMETVDRSSTNGLVLMNVTNVAVPEESARSRATTAMPTAGIWSNIDLAALRANPFKGSLYEADFTHGEGAPVNSFISATYSAAAEGKALTEWMKVGTEVVGNLDHFVTTDNQTVEWQVPCPITVSGGAKWAYEVRFKLSLVDDTKGKMALGLMKPQIMSGDILTDAGAVIDGGFVGLHWKEADGDSIDFVYDETSQTQNEHDADYIVPVAATYITFGMYFNGTTIQGYADGVALGTAISAVDIAAADFPTAEVLCPTFALKGAAADDVTVSIDWIRVAQTA